MNYMQCLYWYIVTDQCMHGSIQMPHRMGGPGLVREREQYTWMNLAAMGLSTGWLTVHMMEMRVIADTTKMLVFSAVTHVRS